MSDAEQASQKTQWLSYGTASIVGKVDEDNFSNNIHDEKFSAFGVFDGHGGKYGSLVCSKLFCKTILETFEKMNAKEGQNTDNMDAVDAVLCESARLTSEKLDHEIKLDEKSGTTATSVFIRLEESGRIRLWCVNIGDSRSVLIRGSDATANDVTLLSEDHNLDLGREVHRIQYKQAPIWYPLPKKPLKWSAMASKLGALDDAVNEDADEAERNTYPNDQDLQNARGLIARLSAGGIDAELNLGPTEDIEDLRELCKQSSSKALAGSSKKQDHVLPTSKTTGDEEMKTDDVLSRRTFIARRTRGGPDPAVGPQALFSNYNISITMTRSLGDKFAARSCVCMPEISVLEIAPQEFARCILGTDGLWEVITPPEAAALVRRVMDPRKAAKLLAKRARQIREDRGIKIDDITVTVVDLNHASPSREIPNAGCGCMIA